MKSVATLLLASLTLSYSAPYELEDVTLPESVPPEVGALTFDSDGYLYVCLRRSDVFRAMPAADPKAFDWKTVTPFYHIGKGKFYGHPSSLVWDKDWPKEKDPLVTYRNDLAAYNKHRTEAAVLVPYEVCRSASEPIMIPRNGSFGAAYVGQFILPDNNGTRLCRIMVEKVDGVFQGMVTYFQNGGGLRSGNNRVAFSPDGKTLYVGQTVRGWGSPAEGLQRITYKGGTPLDVSTVNITKDGFRMAFTNDVPDFSTASIAVSSATYQPTWVYSGKAENKANHTITKAEKTDARTLQIALSDFVPGKVYEIKLPSIKSLQNTTFHYTVHKIPAE